MEVEGSDMIHTGTGWNTQALSMSVGRDGIYPATAAILVRGFESCSNCSSDIDPDPGNAHQEDNDVLWENDARYKSQAHYCDVCETELRIFVEEKVLGIISSEQLPENADETETLQFVPIDGREAYLQVNTFHLKVSEATPRQSNTNIRCGTDA